MPRGPDVPEAACVQYHPREAPCVSPGGVVCCGYGTAGAIGVGVCGVVWAVMEFTDAGDVCAITLAQSKC